MGRRISRVVVSNFRRSSGPPELSPPPAGTDTFMDTDPAGDVKINPPKERRRDGDDGWAAPSCAWEDAAGFPRSRRLNGAGVRSRFGVSGR